ncbi:MAG TPA: hypothetical protein VKS98_13045 [Chthoniobacterales bacterium]|nr:hypothetical protein [Chthoniobacterales bacterium]
MRIAAIHRIAMATGVSRRYLFLAALFLGSCATVSTHQFAQPAATWQTRSGQLLYRTPKTTVIGEAFVRFSNTGDFELRFSKGPVALLTLRQDAQFAEGRGALAGRGWSGSIDHAPQQLRGWLGLRDAIIHSQNRHQVRHVWGSETFVFRF